MKNKPTFLIVLDGLGIGEKNKNNAVFAAQKPHLDAWFKEYPHAQLRASGTAVGLPEGYMGNSEVGHLTLGSGRVIEQPLTIINHAIEDGSFFSNLELRECLEELKARKKKLHIMGLLSDAGVHSHIQHLYAFLKVAKMHDIAHVFVHPFLDGRDTAPTSAINFLSQLDAEIKKIGVGTIGSLCGRYYAMDRDKHWDRTEQAYRMLTQPEKIEFSDWQTALEHYYAKGITDEFIPPTLINAHALINNDDGIIFFNVREERARQLTAAFVAKKFDHFPRKNIELTFFLTPMDYGAHVHTTTMYPRPYISQTLFDVLAHAGKKIFVIAETEKYAHVTYFFNGGREEPVAGETRVLIPSLGTKNYVSHPEMSAREITQTVIDSLEHDPCDFYLINYANADMVAHSGNFDATVKAIECLDAELGKLYEVAVKKMGGTMYITADHGNAEKDFASSVAVTAHTTNSVPFLLMCDQQKNRYEHLLPLHELADVAPCILKQMNLPVPIQMVE